jgi:hypothetical protein
MVTYTKAAMYPNRRIRTGLIYPMQNSKGILVCIVIENSYYTTSSICLNHAESRGDGLLNVFVLVLK